MALVGYAHSIAQHYQLGMRVSRVNHAASPLRYFFIIPSALDAYLNSKAASSRTLQNLAGINGLQLSKANMLSTLLGYSHFIHLVFDCKVCPNALFLFITDYEKTIENCGRCSFCLKNAADPFSEDLVLTKWRALISIQHGSEMPISASSFLNVYSPSNEISTHYSPASAATVLSIGTETPSLPHPAEQSSSLCSVLPKWFSLISTATSKCLLCHSSSCFGNMVSKSGGNVCSELIRIVFGTFTRKKNSCMYCGWVAQGCDGNFCALDGNLSAPVNKSTTSSSLNCVSCFNRNNHFGCSSQLHLRFHATLIAAMHWNHYEPGHCRSLFQSIRSDADISSIQKMIIQFLRELEDTRHHESEEDDSEAEVDECEFDKDEREADDSGFFPFFSHEQCFTVCDRKQSHLF